MDFSTYMAQTIGNTSDCDNEVMTNYQPDLFDFHHFLENENSCYENENSCYGIPTSQIPLPLSPPNSCPVTPTSPKGHNYDIKVQDATGEFHTNAPELEHYLKQTNPLQTVGRKRKCAWVLEGNDKMKATKIIDGEEDVVEEIDQKKIPKTLELSCCQKTLKWSNYNSQECYKLYDSSLIETDSPSLLVTCDKGFTFSPAENVFICQKKNHFQVTLVFNAHESQSFVKIEEVYQNVTSYKVHLYAIKAEAPHKKINMEQSLADRSKRPYHPVKFTTSGCSTKTLTIGRLHFSETTSNNMRKKGKLNPDQRYFLLVVDVRAYTKQGNYSVCCQSSEKLIVRASNPGQFENDVTLWSKDKTGDSVYRVGNVGINTDKPGESLTVHGNFRLTGDMVQPADIRLHEYIEPTDSRLHMENVSNIKLYRYRLSKGYAEYAGLSDNQQKENIGVLAHELKTLIPEAITVSSDIVMPDGKLVKDPLLVNKDRLLMESIGALQEMYKISKILSSRLVELETKTEILELVLKNAISEPNSVPRSP